VGPSSIWKGTLGFKPVMVLFWKFTVMPAFISVEDVRTSPVFQVSVPLHASVAVVSAACAVTKLQITIAVRAIMREQVRSMRESPAGLSGMSVPHKVAQAQFGV
jgi:hypothetical protein